MLVNLSPVHINPLNAASIYIRLHLTHAHRGERIYTLSRNAIPPQPYTTTGAAHLYLMWKLGPSLFIPGFSLPKSQSHKKLQAEVRHCVIDFAMDTDRDDGYEHVSWRECGDFLLSL